MPDRSGIRHVRPLTEKRYGLSGPKVSGAGCGFGHFILKSEKKIVTFVQLTAKRQSNMLSIAERHKYILDNLNKYGFVRITDVANELAPTP